MTDKDKENQNLDRILHHAIGRLTGGISPAALATAWVDWVLHIQGSPQRQIDLVERAWKGSLDGSHEVLRVASGSPHAHSPDPRFSYQGWGNPPFCMYRHWFRLLEAWWEAASAPMAGLDPAHQRIIAFAARQVLDMISPSNFVPTNPEVIDRTKAEAGMNFVRGLRYWLEDFNQVIGLEHPLSSEFRVGETLAITEGDVVFRNDLIELIRYRPTTPRVRAEPVLIVPAWIMKYYILDLSPENSLVAFLRDQGFEVFIISWKNPDAEDADLGFSDYLNLGLASALDVVAPGPEDAVHAVGYCLGGTLLATGASAMARDGDHRLRSLTLLAAQTDFSEPGELSLFINESQIAFLEDMMSVQGFLKADQMAGAFRMLRSSDLIWSRVVRHYLLGERTEQNALMAWNADATRMPARMHSEYLRQMFLENRLAKGQFMVRGSPVALSDIRAPIFCLATERDHVSPWKSVFKLHLLADTSITFCLTSGGHNGGVLSEPGHKGRHYRLQDRASGDKYVSPDTWLADTSQKDGSWWPEWSSWLIDKSGGMRKPKNAGYPRIAKAPGTYVFGN